MGYEQDVADKQAMIEETARRRAQRSGHMGAMHRDQYDTMNDGYPEDREVLNALAVANFLVKLPWGVFTVDFEGNELLEAAARDQSTAIAIAPAISSEARHVRIRRLR